MRAAVPAYLVKHPPNPISPAKNKPPATRMGIAGAFSYCRFDCEAPYGSIDVFSTIMGCVCPAGWVERTTCGVITISSVA